MRFTLERQVFSVRIRDIISEHRDEWFPTNFSSKNLRSLKLIPKVWSGCPRPCRTWLAAGSSREAAQNRGRKPPTGIPCYFALTLRSGGADNQALETRRQRLLPGRSINQDRGYRLLASLRILHPSLDRFPNTRTKRWFLLFHYRLCIL